MQQIYWLVHRAQNSSECKRNNEHIALMLSIGEEGDLQ